MQQNYNNKTLIQCDFDGTLTHDDIGFLILDSFAEGDWRSLLEQYKSKKISVGQFNTQVFRMVKQEEATLTRFVKEKAQMRTGFTKLLDYCLSRGFRFVIVSNGMTFYIKTLLDDIGVNNVEIQAAQAVFNSHGIEARYLGPDGKEIDNGFKEAYLNKFLKEGYRVINIGNGASDIPTARLAHLTFATEPMLSLCRQMKVDCFPFENLDDVIEGLQTID